MINLWKYENKTINSLFFNNIPKILNWQQWKTKFPADGV